MKKDISEVDSNFKVERVENIDVCFYEVPGEGFSLEGFPWKPYYRLPEHFTEKEVNKGALTLAPHTTGGCVRFVSDAPVIVLRAELQCSYDMDHMPRCASAGFDIYKQFHGGTLKHGGTVMASSTFAPVETFMHKEESKGKVLFQLNLPLYGGVKKLEIGFPPGYKPELPPPHRVKDPVLFYGSSITQGGCASRPGNAYTSLLCRAVDAPQINLGFSGSGKGEIAMAQAIAKLKLSCFVMDYDHNASNPEYLQNTHEKFFQEVRRINPDLPVIMLSKPDFEGDPNAAQRREIIRQTYERAKSSGDKNVYFIDGETLFGTENRDACTVDRCHPNDLGFYRMYQHILPVLSEILG